MDDLDINNYDLKDLLTLFKLPSTYTKSDLFQVKKLLAKYHPDKASNTTLPKEYYHFLKQAYDVLNNLLTKPEERDNYEVYSKEVLDQYFGGEKVDNFNGWFNKHFENVAGDTNSKGYESWFRDKPEPELKQPQQSALINGFYLDGREDKDYNSDLFAPCLQYQDLYEAHNTETLKPETSSSDHIDFKNAMDLKSFRDTQNITPLTKEESLHQLSQTEIFQKEQALQRSYNLMKEGKHFVQRQNEFLNRLK